jgi:proteasome activator subunit 4
MASVLNAIDQLKVSSLPKRNGFEADGIKFHPSYPSVAALVNDVLEDTMSEKDIMHIRNGRFTPYLKEIMESLPAHKAERPHGPKATLSVHDNTALTSELTLARAMCLS